MFCFISWGLMVSTISPFALYLPRLIVLVLDGLPILRWAFLCLIVKPITFIKNLLSMTLQDAILLSRNIITNKIQHEHYERVVELAETYEALITGEEIGRLLRQFVKREDQEAFEQRARLTTAITPAVCSALQKPFNKVLRNDKVKKYYDFGTQSRNDIVSTMRDRFYGRKRSRNRGFDYWIKRRLATLTFTDPNAFIVYEWDAPESRADIVTVRPFEVSAEEAWNFKIVNEELIWLFVAQDTIMDRLIKPIGKKVDVPGFEVVPAMRYTLYSTDYTIVYQQIDKDAFVAKGEKLQSNQELYQDPTTKEWYIQSTYEPNLGYVPAFRVGYVDDIETDGHTCVNAWHYDAMPYLMKSVKTVSEMDLSMCLHVFPQKLQYVQRCPGNDKKGCDKGRTKDGRECSMCNGQGYKVHTTAQDALLFPMPDPGTPANEIMDLDKLLVYKAPPIDLLKFQKEYIDSLKSDCMTAMFGQGSYVKAGAPAQDSGKTATEVNYNMQGVYDAVFPFTEKISDVWVDGIYTFGRVAGVPESAEPTIVHVFPADLKLKSLEELLSDLKAANESGAPSFLRDSINNDIAAVLYEGDELAERKHEVKHIFYPFNGQTPDDVAMSMGSQYVSKFTKVLYSNFDSIISDIEFDNPDWWWWDINRQWQAVEAMTEVYIEEIDNNSVPNINFNIDTPPAGAGTDNTTDNTGDNPGDNSGDNTDNQDQ